MTSGDRASLRAAPDGLDAAAAGRIIDFGPGLAVECLQTARCGRAAGRVQLEWNIPTVDRFSAISSLVLFVLSLKPKSDHLFKHIDVYIL